MQSTLVGSAEHVGLAEAGQGVQPIRCMDLGMRLILALVCGRMPKGLNVRKVLIKSFARAPYL